MLWGIKCNRNDKNKTYELQLKNPVLRAEKDRLQAFALLLDKLCYICLERSEEQDRVCACGYDLFHHEVLDTNRDKRPGFEVTTKRTVRNVYSRAMVDFAKRACSDQEFEYFFHRKLQLSLTCSRNPALLSLLKDIENRRQEDVHEQNVTEFASTAPIWESIQELMSELIKQPSCDLMFEFLWEKDVKKRIVRKPPINVKGVILPKKPVSIPRKPSHFDAMRKLLAVSFLPSCVRIISEFLLEKESRKRKTIGDSQKKRKQRKSKRSESES